jgi:hypothetical protein
MLHREEAAGLVVITQPAHAWVAGQLARAWGNARFGALAPREEVCLGAEQHDIGWTAWEGAPTLNPATGRPHAFTQMPLAAHLAIWSSAGSQALAQGRYAALLVSMHGTHLYGGRDTSRDSPAEAEAVREFLARERAFQAELLASLRAEPRYAAVATPDTIARHQRLVAIWDRLSLALCIGLRAERRIEGVPTADGVTTLTLTPGGGDPAAVAVAPWPFQDGEVTLVCDGRRLPETFADEAAMRAALGRAPWATIEVGLRPGAEV